MHSKKINIKILLLINISHSVTIKILFLIFIPCFFVILMIIYLEKTI